MKKILIQLDSDRFASTFDCIVAYDAGVDIVQSYGGVTATDVRALILGAFFTRGISDLRNIAVWIGGSDVEVGEQILAQALKTFFGPFRVSLMLDSNGCNTTACTAVAKLARETQLTDKAALVIGPGPVGVRTALLLAVEGCRVILVSIPPQLLGPDFKPEFARRTLDNALRVAKAFPDNPAAVKGGSIQVRELAGVGELEEILDQVEVVAAAGPAGFCLLRQELWSARSNIKWLIDFNLTEPLGIEGIRPADDFAPYEDKRTLGALAIGNPKMKVHKACIERLFERNDLILDTEGVYQIAKQLI